MGSKESRQLMVMLEALENILKCGDENFKDAEGNKTDPLLGLFLSGNYTYEADTRPSLVGVYRMTDVGSDALRDIPLR